MPLACRYAGAGRNCCGSAPAFSLGLDHLIKQWTRQATLMQIQCDEYAVPDNYGDMTAAIIRDAVHDDIPAIADILMRSSRTAYTFMPWFHSDDDFVEFVRASFDEWDVVRIAETVRGRAGFHCLLKDVVDQLFVAPEAQQRGVGSTLLRDVMTLRPHGFTLRIFQANRASRAFYEVCGLVAIDFGSSEAENEPDVIYRWNP